MPAFCQHYALLQPEQTSLFDRPAQPINGINEETKTFVQNPEPTTEPLSSTSESVSESETESSTTESSTV